MLVVLIGLDGNRGQSGIAGNRLGFTQIPVPGGKAVVEQAEDINLRAGGRHMIKVEVMNIDIAFAEGFRMLRPKQIHFIVCLGTGRPDLQHAAHGGIAVNIGVVTLQVAGNGVLLRDLIDRLHQGSVGIACMSPVGAVKDIGLCRVIETILHQLMLHGILNGLDIR